MEIKKVCVFSLACLFLQFQVASAAYLFQGDTVAIGVTEGGIPVSIVTAQPNVTAASVNSLNAANGAYFTLASGLPNENRSVGIPYSAVPESGFAGFSGTSNTSIYFANFNNGAPYFDNNITINLSQLGWAQNPGNPNYISGINYAGLQSGSNLSTITFGSLPFSISPHGISINIGSDFVDTFGKLQANFDVVMSTPLMTLPTVVGHTVTAKLQATDFSGNVVSPGTNQFNNALTPVSAVVTGNSATPEFSAAATSITANLGVGISSYSLLSLTANLDSNIIDLIWNTPASCPVGGCVIAPTKLTLTNILDAAGMLAGYEITSLELLSGQLPAGISLLSTVITGGDVALYLSGGLVTAGRTYEALFHAVDSAPPETAVPEPSTYILMASLLLIGIGMMRRKASLA